MKSKDKIPAMTPYIVMRIVPVITIILLLIGWYSTVSINAVVSEELRSRKEQIADEIASNINLRLAGLRESVMNIAANDLITNGLVDAQERHRYLPIYFASVGLAGVNDVEISLLNYRGVTIASNLPTKEREKALEAYFVQDAHYFMRDHEMVLVQPIKIAGATEGAVVARVLGASFDRMFQTPVDQIAYALVNDQGELVYGAGDQAADLVAVANDPSRNSWQITTRTVNEFEQLTILVGEPRIVTFDAARRTTLLMWIAIVVSICATVLAIFATGYMGSSALRNLGNEFRRVSAFSDLDKRVRAQGIAEAQELASAFNSVLSALKVTSASAEDLATAVKELKRSNRELDDFAYIASHDLKEPLRAITNHAAFLLEDYADILDDAGKARVGRLKVLSKRMSELISQLNYYSRLGRNDQNTSDVQPEKIVQNIVEDLQEFLTKHKASVEIADNLPTLSGNSAQLNVLFRNLIVNGVRYNRSARPAITIGAEQNVTVGDVHFEQAIYVQDNGIGMAPEQVDDAFRIFKRLTNSDEFGDGTGVGLTFVKKIIEGHNGDFAVETEPGVGTKIYFWLNPVKNNATIAQGFA